VVVAVLDGLRQAGEGKAEEVEDAIRRYGIDPESPNPGRA
jgi:pyruvate dehydrogenase complex dehydrogenase (E1) component